MSSNADSGHARNVANFEALISFCNGYGAAYNPAKTTLQAASLQTVLTASKAALADCKSTETAFDNATNARKDAFTDLRALSTRIVNALAVSGVSDTVVQSAKNINRKIQGQKANGTSAAQPAAAGAAGDAAATAKAATASSSQQSYDYLAEHFSGLIELVSTQAAYAPNEAELKVATLQTYLATLRDANTNVRNAYTPWSNSRLNRNNTLYGSSTGLVDCAQDVKAYIKSVFNATSQQYAQVKGIEFKSF